MEGDTREKRGWRARWQERRRRRNQQLAERLGRRPPRPDEAHSPGQAEQAVRSVPTSSGGMIG